MPRKHRSLKLTAAAAKKPENKPLYFTDGGRRLLKTSRGGESARQQAVSCGYFVYLIDPEKFYREFEEGN